MGLTLTLLGNARPVQYISKLFVRDSLTSWYGFTGIPISEVASAQQSVLFPTLTLFWVSHKRGFALGVDDALETVPLRLSSRSQSCSEPGRLVTLVAPKSLYVPTFCRSAMGSPALGTLGLLGHRKEERDNGLLAVHTRRPISPVRLPFIVQDVWSYESSTFKLPASSPLCPRSPRWIDTFHSVTCYCHLQVILLQPRSKLCMQRASI